MQMTDHGIQLKSFGIQLQNIGTQIQNIGMNIPFMGNEIHNMGLQISTIGNQIFSIGMSFLNLLIPMNNMNNMNNIINQMSNINEINKSNFNILNKEKFNQKDINILFEIDRRRDKIYDVRAPEEATVGELIKSFFNKINRNPNDDEFWFLFNGNKMELNCKKSLKEYGLIESSKVSVISKRIITA